jgi:4'-phosphopantetheinyl transferase
MTSTPWEPVPAVPRMDGARGGACLVWWAEPGWVHGGLTTVLDGAERDRLRRYRRPADRARFAAGVVVSRVVLGALLGVEPGRVALDRSCPTCGEPHGPPRLAGGDRPPLHLSVSHAGNRVVVAVATAPGVGVDVEAVPPDLRLDGLCGQVLTPEEAAGLTGLPAADRVGAFLSYWTRKEAVVKATGDGLRADPRRIRVTPPSSQPELLEWPDRPGMVARTAMHTLHPGPGYAACLALLDQPSARVRELSAAAILAA